MAVFTKISKDECAIWLKQHYRLAELIDIIEISDGIENSNYKIICADNSSYVLTLLEVWSAELCEQYAMLMRHLAQNNIPTPEPLTNNDNKLITICKQRPALIVPFVQGKYQQTLGATQFSQVCALLAQIQIVANKLPNNIDNPRGYAWRQETYPKLMKFLSAEQQNLLHQANCVDKDLYTNIDLASMRIGHLDLFSNNVLWQDNKLAAVIDFYFGGKDLPTYDLAVMLLACLGKQLAVDQQQIKLACDTYLQTYLQHNLPVPNLDNLPQAFVVAALRFWLSRLYDFHIPRPAHNLTAHDPSDFEELLRLCIGSEFQNMLKDIVNDVNINLLASPKLAHTSPQSACS